MIPPRSRVAYGIALVPVIAGLGSRAFGRSLPWVIATYAGDTLYATMVFVVLGILARRWSTARLALTALACSSRNRHLPWRRSSRSAWRSAPTR